MWNGSLIEIFVCLNLCKTWGCFNSVTSVLLCCVMHLNVYLCIQLCFFCAIGYRGRHASKLTEEEEDEEYLKEEEDGLSNTRLVTQPSCKCSLSLCLSLSLSHTLFTCIGMHLCMWNYACIHVFNFTKWDQFHAILKKKEINVLCAFVILTLDHWSCCNCVIVA